LVKQGFYLRKESLEEDKKKNKKGISEYQNMEFSLEKTKPINGPALKYNHPI